MRKQILDLIYRNRLHGKRAVAWAGRVLPAPLFKPLRTLAEQLAFRAQPQYQGETLPPIFHYWSTRHLAPTMQRLGIPPPEQFYFDQIRLAAELAGRSVHVLSVGSGSCDLEIRLATRLKAAGIAATLTCVDFNAQLMRTAAESATTAGLADAMTFIVADCNTAKTFPPSDVIIVNQFFHHVENLEGFCAALACTLTPDGRLLTSDIIGRNGHLLWPDVEERVLRYWAELPEDKRMDRYFGSVQRDYRPMDHAAYSNEGIRAQDVVASLVSCFDFEVFFTFGGVIMPFVERRIGFNFNPDDPEDRAFVDRVATQDAQDLSEMRYPPSNMIAVLRHRGKADGALFEPVSPERYLAGCATQRELASTPSR